MYSLKNLYHDILFFTHTQKQTKKSNIAAHTFLTKLILFARPHDSRKYFLKNKFVHAKAAHTDTINKRKLFQTDFTVSSWKLKKKFNFCQTLSVSYYYFYD